MHLAPAIRVGPPLPATGAACVTQASKGTLSSERDERAEDGDCERRRQRTVDALAE